MTTVSVFGGTGFLGRRLVRRLVAEGATLRIAVWSPDRARSVLGAVDRDHVMVLRADVRDQASVAAAVAGVDAVVNAVSTYIEKPGVTVESVHEQGARTVAEEAAADRVSFERTFRLNRYGDKTLRASCLAVSLLRTANSLEIVSGFEAVALLVVPIELVGVFLPGNFVGTVAERLGV